MKRKIIFFLLLGCQAFFPLQSLWAGDSLLPLTYRIWENGTVLVDDSHHNIGYVQPEIFTEGWKYNGFKNLTGKNTRGFIGTVDLGSGQTVDLKVSVETLPEGVGIHYVLIPRQSVQVLQVRVPLYLSYPEWQEDPYVLGTGQGVVPQKPAGGWGLITQADGQPLTLGPSPALGRLQIYLDPKTAHLDLIDSRQWLPSLLASIHHNEPSEKPWTWKAGEEKRFDFTLSFNRQVSSAPTPTPEAGPHMDPKDSVFIPADDPGIRYSGRFDFSDPKAPRFDWPAVSISTVFQGNTVGILLDDGTNDYDAFIDGKLQKVIVTDGAKQYTVGGLGPGPHTLLLIKRTEATFGIATFKGLLLQKGMSLLKPPSPPSRRIEFVGDSLACGAEVEDSNTSCEPSHFRPTANSYLAFGPLAAQALDADYRVTSYSGTGILKQFGDANLSMPGYYRRVLAGEENPVIDPHQWVPDAVVIELSGNDFFSGTPPPSQKDFEEAYKNFIAVLRSDYPQAHIFCLTFGTKPPAGTLIQEIVAQENEFGDTKIRLMDVHYPVAHVTGCYEHFDPVGQKQVAEEVTKVVREGMGWNKGKTK